MSTPEEVSANYVTLELPIRLTRAELGRLNEAASEGAALTRFGDPCLQRARDRAQEVLRVNRMRSAIVGADLFGDPAWNLLLDLFVREADGKSTTVTSACIGADAPSTTALRYLGHLVERGLVERISGVNDDDGRRVYVRLTSDGSERLLKLLG